MVNVTKRFLNEIDSILIVLLKKIHHGKKSLCYMVFIESWLDVLFFFFGIVERFYFIINVKDL